MKVSFFMSFYTPSLPRETSAPLTSVKNKMKVKSEVMFMCVCINNVSEG